MSFGDPYGPFQPGVGADIVWNMPDGRPDINFVPVDDFQLPVRPRSGGFLKSCGLFAAATAGLTALVAIPVFISEVAMIETVRVSGKTLTAVQFADRLENLFIGSFIVAVSLVSFVASAAFASPRLGVREMKKDPSLDERQDLVDPVLTALTKVRHV